MKKYLFPVLICFCIICFTHCQSEKKAPVVEVTAQDFKFEVADEIPSGWTTFRFVNNGMAEHFFLLNKLPDSIPFERYRTEVTKPFDVVFDSIKAGMPKTEAIGLLVNTLPPWYFTAVKSFGGPSFIPKGESTEVTMNLSPGHYEMECYIKYNGVFHTALGMIRPLLVKDSSNNNLPPLSNVDLNLSNNGISITGTIKKGENIFAVHYLEHPEAGLGNDVHLFKINPDIPMDSVKQWFDWTNVKGLEPPAPVEFLGGVQEMPKDSTSYFKATLGPGNYALISENASATGLVKEFTVE